MDLYFSDLIKEAQIRLLVELGLSSCSEANWDVFPITTIDCTNEIIEELIFADKL